MDDRQMDAYVSRCMKNWAASQSLPSGSRERLLRAAEIRPDLYRVRLGAPLSELIKALFYTQQVIEPEPDWLFVPFTQSRLWSFHIAVSSRVAA